MVPETLSVSAEMAEIFNSNDWETISFKVHTKTYHAPKFRFVYAKICPGKENPVLVALKQMPSSTKYAIKVDESITESDFEILLSLLYPTGLVYVDTPLKDLWTNDQWSSILKISSLWFYQDLRTLALRHLNDDSLSTIDMISLGRAYSVPEWVSEGLCALGHSHSLIDANLFDSIGHLTALRIYQIRERKEFPEARVNEDNGKFTAEYIGVEEDVDRVFREELERLEKDFEEYAIPKITRPAKARSASFGAARAPSPEPVSVLPSEYDARLGPTRFDYPTLRIGSSTDSFESPIHPAVESKPELERATSSPCYSSKHELPPSHPPSPTHSSTSKQGQGPPSPSTPPQVATSLPRGSSSAERIPATGRSFYASRKRSTDSMPEKVMHMVKEEGFASRSMRKDARSDPRVDTRESEESVRASPVPQRTRPTKSSVKASSTKTSVGNSMKPIHVQSTPNLRVDTEAVANAAKNLWATWSQAPSHSKGSGVKLDTW